MITVSPFGQCRAFLTLASCIAAMIAYGLHAAHAQAGAAAPSQAAAGPTIITDLPYIAGGDPAQKLDLYLPAQHGGGPVPLVICIHGGACIAGSKSDEKWQCLHWVGLGYASASIEYRFSQVAIFPAQIQDCQAAVRWLRANSKQYDIDPRHFGASGESAGGLLVALLGTSGGKHVFPAIGGNVHQSDRVQAVIDQAGPADYTTVCSQAAADKTISFGYNLATGGGNGAYSWLIGVKQLSDDRHKTDAVSPVHYVSKDNPPFLIIHGTIDNAVPFAQSVELAAALNSAGAVALMQRLPGSGHGGGAADYPAVWSLRDAFYNKYLRHMGGDVSVLPDSAVTLGP